MGAIKRDVGTEQFYEYLSDVILFHEGQPYYLINIGKKIKAFTLAGSLQPSGHRKIGSRVQGRFRVILAHRLAWYQEHGYIPEYLDHINRDPDDNRIANLRECSLSNNQRNRVPRGASRYMGVSVDVSGKYKAFITVKKKQHYLGLFADEIEAALAYDRAAIKYGVSEFCNLNFGETCNAK